MLKALVILYVFMFFFWLFGYAEEELDQKAKANFKIYDITDLTTDN